MFLVHANEIEFDITLETHSPLLIRDGRLNKESRERWLQPVLHRIQGDAQKLARQSETPSAIPVSRDSAGAVQLAVTTGDPVSNVNNLTLYIPGSSLRGVWRSYLESQMRGLTPADSPKVCDPLEERAAPLRSCSQLLTELIGDDTGEEDEEVGEGETPPPPMVPYRISCPVCRLFGNSHQGGRLSITDGERVAGSGQIVSREHVTIDRRTGQVSNGPFKFFGLKGAKFSLKVKIVNFELWQLRLLAELLHDAADRLVPIGSCKSKGYGANSLIVDRVRLAYFGTGPFEEQLYGVAEHPNHGEWFQQRYGIQAAPTPRLPVAIDGTSPWRKTASLAEPQHIAALLQACRTIDLPLEGFRILQHRGPGQLQ